MLVHLRELKDKEEAAVATATAEIFVAFANLVLGSRGSNVLRHLINEDASAVEWRMDFFDKLLEQNLPELHRQFRAVNLKHEFYLMRWLSTLFLNVQGLEGLEFCLRIWDQYLLHGEPFLYCVAIAIMKYKQHKLANQPMETCLAFFQRIKSLKIPQQCMYWKVDQQRPNLPVRRAPEFREYSGGTGGSSGAPYASEDDGSSFPSERAGAVSNTDSFMMLQLMQDAISIMVGSSARALFREHLIQQ